MARWLGQLHGEHAFSKLNRNLLNNLKDTLNDSGLTIVSQYPYIDPPNNNSALVMTWEFGGERSLPKEWVQQANKYKATLAMSDWVGRVFHLNGIKNVSTFHLGVDETLYFPREVSKDRFRVLLFGGSDPRHGTDLGIKAFQKAFGDCTKTELVVKNSYGYPEPKVPLSKNIRFINSVIAEEDLPDFYSSFDCLLLPLRGAGPGLIGMEAMACGLPVIMPRGSGMQEYSKYCYPVEYTIEKTKHHCVPAPEPYWLTPSIDSMVNQLLDIYANPVPAKEVGKKASEYIRTEWTWRKSAERLSYIFNALEKEIEVSIVILVGPRKEPVLSRCVDSIIEHTKDIGFELVIVDQNLPDWEYCVDNGLKHPYNNVIRLNYNSGVSGGRNIGMRASRGKYTLFLDDDAYVTRDGWLEDLLQYFKDPTVGIVGQTGVYIPEGQWGMFYEAQGVTECDVVQGYCQIFPTELRNRISIDEKYGKFWHEDADWCLQIRELGYKVIDANNVGVYHLGSMSGDDGTYVTKATYLKNKWQGKPSIRVKKPKWNAPYTIEHD